MSSAPGSKSLRDNVPELGTKAVLSVHCHNDLGLAVANSIAACQTGAGQVECTINGIGERAGNASLEEFVMACRTRRDMLDFYTEVVTEEIYPIEPPASPISPVYLCSRTRPWWARTPSPTKPASTRTAC